MEEKYEVLKNLQSKFGDKIKNIFWKNARRIYLEVSPDDLPLVAQFLFFNQGLRFATASGVDTRPAIEILYHFSDDKTGKIISVRVYLNKSNPQISSLAPYFKATEWIEREIHEMLGVNFIGHPNLTHLLLRSDWPEGQYPLRQDEKQ